MLTSITWSPNKLNYTLLSLLNSFSKELLLPPLLLLLLLFCLSSIFFSNKSLTEILRQQNGRACNEEDWTKVDFFIRDSEDQTEVGFFTGD